MKKTYTKKQITEAIQYWKNYLSALDESYESEMEVAKALRDSMVSQLASKVGKSKALRMVNIQETTPREFLKSTPLSQRKQFCIMRAGNSMASDIYIYVPDVNDVDNYSMVGIEVKERVDSHLFNPRLVYRLSNNSLVYQNSQFDLGKIDPDDYRTFTKLLTSRAKKSQIATILKDFAKMLNFCGIKTDGFPLKIAETPYEFKKRVCSKIFINFTEEKYDDLMLTYAKHHVNDIDGFDGFHGLKVSPEFIQFCNDQRISDLSHSKFIDLMLTSAKSTQLAQYELRNNDVIRLYFNNLRTKGDSYSPVQYMQYGKTLYKLTDDNSIESNFIVPNSPYRIANYDEDFGGVKMIWRLDFKDNMLQIRGDVKSIPAKANGSNLFNAKSFGFNIPENAIEM